MSVVADCLFNGVFWMVSRLYLLLKKWREFLFILELSQIRRHADGSEMLDNGN